MKFYINQALERAGHRRFIASIHVFDAELNPLQKIELEYENATLVYAGYKSLFRAIDVIAVDGATIDLATNVGPLFNELRGNNSQQRGTLYKILDEKLTARGMKIENIKRL
jgi:hypothetical protein